MARFDVTDFEGAVIEPLLPIKVAAQSRPLGADIASGVSGLQG